MSQKVPCMVFSIYSDYDDNLEYNTVRIESLVMSFHWCGCQKVDEQVEIN